MENARLCEAFFSTRSRRFEVFGLRDQDITQKKPQNGFENF